MFVATKMILVAAPANKPTVSVDVKQHFNKESDRTDLG